MIRFPRWLEEIFPFAAYLHAKWKIDREIDDVIESGTVSPPIKDAFNRYRKLNLAELDSCLQAEHERTNTLADKTFKFGTSFATALTIASTATALLAETLSGTGWKVAVLASAGP
ncbi:MAG: hypothetical protein R3268_06490, partial [Acidiferrobacterales bacterium]|nr:hypothetical protein [Acidiferrobacterales bacterium]